MTAPHPGSSLMSGEQSGGVGANALTGTALPGEAQAPAGLGPDGRVSAFADFDDEECDDGAFAFECAGYYPEPASEFYCPLWGTEECDWECPHGGLAS